MKLASKWLRATPALVIASLMATPAFADTCADMTAQINKGDTTWMLISSALVLMMSVPALALFYGGLVRTKNMLSVLTQVFMIV
jgi:Amt family ammonium transporter